MAKIKTTKEEINIHEIVYSFKTKYKGFMDSEMKELIKLFPTITTPEFNKALGTRTCLVIEDNCITFKHDIEKAIRCCIEKRGLKLGEFD